jgi:hypothetical protein
MCQHPFPFELLTQNKAGGEHSPQSHAVLNDDWHAGGVGSRLSLAGVIFTSTAAALALFWCLS